MSDNLRIKEWIDESSAALDESLAALREARSELNLVIKVYEENQELKSKIKAAETFCSDVLKGIQGTNQVEDAMHVLKLLKQENS